MQNFTLPAIVFVNSLRIILLLIMPKSLIILHLQYYFFVAKFVFINTSIRNKTKTKKWLCNYITSLKYFFEKILEILEFLLIILRYGQNSVKKNLTNKTKLSNKELMIKPRHFYNFFFYIIRGIKIAYSIIIFHIPRLKPYQIQIYNIIFLKICFQQNLKLRTSLYTIYICNFYILKAFKALIKNFKKQ